MARKKLGIAVAEDAFTMEVSGDYVYNSMPVSTGAYFVRAKKRKFGEEVSIFNSQLL